MSGQVFTVTRFTDGGEELARQTGLSWTDLLAAVKLASGCYPGELGLGPQSKTADWERKSLRLDTGSLLIERADG